MVHALQIYLSSCPANLKLLTFTRPTIYKYKPSVCVASNGEFQSICPLDSPSIEKTHAVFRSAETRNSVLALHCERKLVIEIDFFIYIQFHQYGMAITTRI